MDATQFAKLNELRQVAEEWLANHETYQIGAQDPDLQSKADYMRQVLQRCREVGTEYQRLQAQGGYKIVFMGVDDLECNNTRRNVEEIGKAYTGKLTVEIVPEQDPAKLRAKYGLEAFPTLVFMNGNRPVAKHQGVISQSMLAKKADMLLSGGDFSDSKKGNSLQGEKTVSDQQTVAVGEYLVLYFEAAWCGVSKMMTPLVHEAILNTGNRIKLEKFDVDYRPKIAEKFHVEELPTTVFLYKGKEVGRLTGYFDNSQVLKVVEHFANNRRAPKLRSDKTSPARNPNPPKE